MSGITKKLKISKLVNYYENPRHAIGANETDTLTKLFKSVGVQYMLNLASDIQERGLLPNQQIVAVYSEEMQKYVVYEGNRRIAAIKLLLDPERFSFLDKASIEKAKKISQKGLPSNLVNCYITDEDEAFYIMEKLHSGEDRGRGPKQWTSREKAVFKVRQNHEKNLSYLVDFYIKDFFDGFDITTILPFTTIQRIFNNREIKHKIGLNVDDESTFTRDRMQLVIDASKWVLGEASSEGISVTRLFNKARTIEDKLLPWIETYVTNNDLDNTQAVTDENSGNHSATNHAALSSAGSSNEQSTATPVDASTQTTPQVSEDTPTFSPPINISTQSADVPTQSTDVTNQEVPNSNTRSNAKTPYFFQGLQCNSLNPSDPTSHGVSAVCKELQLFSDRKLVSLCPIASAFLVRSLIEQTLIYFSKKHTMINCDKLIWENLQKNKSLSQKIDNFMRNIDNYILDTNMRQYFSKIFGNYQDTVDPLNWVVHRPSEFQLDAQTLIDLPRKGLLALINYMLS